MYIVGHVSRASKRGLLLWRQEDLVFLWELRTQCTWQFRAVVVVSVVQRIKAYLVHIICESSDSELHAFVHHSSSGEVFHYSVGFSTTKMKVCSRFQCVIDIYFQKGFFLFHVANLLIIKSCFVLLLFESLLFC